MSGPRLVTQRFSTPLRHLAVVSTAGAIFFLQGPEFVHHPAGRLVAGGDAILNAWILAWSVRALFVANTSVWDAPIFYPTPNALTLSENLFGNLWIAAPAQLLFSNPVLTANLVLFASFVLSMYATYLLVQELTGNFWAALIAGFLFSYSPFRWSHASHLQLLPFFFAPIALLFLHRFMDGFRWRYCALILLAVWAQYYTSIYLGTLLLTLLLVTFGVWLVATLASSQGRRSLPLYKLAPLALISAASSALVLAPIGLKYLETARTWNQFRDLEESARYSAQPIGFLMPGGGGFRNYEFLTQWLAGVNQQWEGRVFLGLLPWCLAIFGVVVVLKRIPSLTAEQKRTAGCYTVTAAVMAILMLGPYITLHEGVTIPLPFQLVHSIVPGGMAVRVPARFVHPLLLCLSVLGAFALTVFLARLGQQSWRKRIAATGALGFVAIWDYGVYSNPGVSLEDAKAFPPVYSYLAQGARSRPVLEVPIGVPGIDEYIFQYLHYQTLHWRPLVGGTSGFWPPGAAELQTNMAKCPSEPCFEFLRITPAMTLVIHLDRYSLEKRSAWQAADPEPYGFRSVGSKGGALVWERLEDPPRSTETLTVVDASLRQQKAGMELRLALRPTQDGLPWRLLHERSEDVDVALVGSGGQQYQYRASVQMPSYILPGGSAEATLIIANVPPQTTTVSLSAPRIEDFTMRWTTLAAQAGKEAPSTPRASISTASYQAMIEQMRRVVQLEIPERATVLVVSQGDEQLLELVGRQGWHFPGDESGQYLGYYPADSADAITQLEDLRAHGGQYIVIPSTSGWWLDYYSDFRRHLDTYYSRIREDYTSCIIYDLKEARSAR